MDKSSDTTSFGWRAWSTVRKAQVIGALVGALLTVINLATTTWDFGLPAHSTAAYWSLWVWQAINTPGGVLGRLIGLREGATPGLWFSLMVVANALIGTGIGTAIGLLSSRYPDYE